MLTAFRLGNFKAFAETQTIPLRRLTLIFGPNSSGKSSIIHGLLCAREAILSGNVDVKQTALGGDAVDLGGFWQFVHRRNFGRDVHWGAEISSPDFESRRGIFDGVDNLSVDMKVGSPSQRQPLQGADVPAFQNPVETDDLTLLATEFQANHQTVIQLVLNRNGYLQIEPQANLHRVFETAVHHFAGRAIRPRGRKQQLGIQDLIQRTLRRYKLKSQVRMISLVDVLPELSAAPRLPRTVDKTTWEKAALEWAVRGALDEVVRGLEYSLVRELLKLNYLGPLRSYPPRRLIFEAQNDPNWSSGGGRAYEVLKDDPAVRNAVNRWLGDEQKLRTPYELVVQNLWTMAEVRRVVELSKAALETVESGLIEFVGSKLKAGQKPTAAEALDQTIDTMAEVDSIAKAGEVPGFCSYGREVYLLDKRANTLVSHRDVGIGVSQVLPVLVNAYGLRNQLIAIEQPEIHLHPALQADLADVFIESALGGRRNMFILETHSEHLILRVLRRIRETTEKEQKLVPRPKVIGAEPSEGSVPIHPEDVAVLYVLPTPEGSKVIEIPIRPDGEFATPWPEGFFPDRVKELF